MARRTDPKPATVTLVRERDAWSCVRCGIGQQLSTQHRVARGMGGSRAEWINLPANLITLCGDGTTGCHGWVESHPKEAREHGYACSRYVDPVDHPVRTWRGRVWLTNDGQAIPV